MTTFVFFYGTLMAALRPRGPVYRNLRFLGRGQIRAALFDLGPYPAARPSSDGVVRGELYQMSNPAGVLEVLDAIEGYRPDDVEQSLYVRKTTSVTLETGDSSDAWVYFYNRDVGSSPQIRSGDYLEYLRATRGDSNGVAAGSDRDEEVNDRALDTVGQLHEFET